MDMQRTVDGQPAKTPIEAQYVVQETALRRQMDIGQENGCKLYLPAAKASAIAVEYSTYERNRQLAWSRLIRSEKLLHWLFATDSSLFSAAGRVCDCGGKMASALRYDRTWRIAVCGSCCKARWEGTEHGSAFPPFDLNLAEMVDGSKKAWVSEQLVDGDMESSGVSERKVRDSAVLHKPEVTVQTQEDVTTGITVRNPETGALEAPDFVAALSDVADYIEWAAKYQRQERSDKVQEILDGVTFALGEFLKDSDVAALRQFHIPLGPSLARIVRDKGKSSKQSSKSTVRWEMSLAHIRSCMDRHTANLNVLKGRLKPIMDRSRIDRREADEIAKRLAQLENIFSGAPERTVGNLAFPTESETPASETIWGLSRLGMLVHRAPGPIDKMNIGEYFRYKRLSCGFSRREVAQAAKMPPEKYDNIERGKQRPKRSDVSRIVNAIPGTDLPFALDRRGIDQ